MSKPSTWDTHIQFDSTPFRDERGRLQVLVVLKKTRLQLYLQQKEALHLDALLSHQDPSVDDLQQAHDLHMECLGEVKRVLQKYDADLLTCYRRELPNAPIKKRIVITVGGDGTVLDAAHYIRDNPLLGVNSDPLRSVGSLCVATFETFERIFDLLDKNRLLMQPVARLEGVLDGRSLPVLALNEILVAHENPAAMSRYIIAVNGEEEEQKSSGVWIGAPAGSSGAAVSAGGLVQSLDDQRMQVVVREPYFIDGVAPRFLSGFISADRKVTIQSQMPEGHVYIDGPHRSISFGLGSCLEVNANGYPLPLLVTPEMEQRRQAIGLLREEHHREMALNRHKLMFNLS